MGPPYGVPVSLKDQLNVKGLDSTLDTWVVLSLRRHLTHLRWTYSIADHACELEPEYDSVVDNISTARCRFVVDACNLSKDDIDRRGDTGDIPVTGELHEA